MTLYLLKKGKEMKSKMVKRIVLEPKDDMTIGIIIDPIICKSGEKKDDDNHIMWCEPVTATAKNYEEAFEKIMGVLELKNTDNQKPRNVIAEFLQG